MQYSSDRPLVLWSTGEHELLFNQSSSAFFQHHGKLKETSHASPPTLVLHPNLKASTHRPRGQTRPGQFSLAPDTFHAFSTNIETITVILVVPTDRMPYQYIVSTPPKTPHPPPSTPRIEQPRVLMVRTASVIGFELQLPRQLPHFLILGAFTRTPGRTKHVFVQVIGPSVHLQLLPQAIQGSKENKNGLDASKERGT